MASDPSSKNPKISKPKDGPPVKPHPTMPDGSGKRPGRATVAKSDAADSRWYGTPGKGGRPNN